MNNLYNAGCCIFIFIYFGFEIKSAFIDKNNPFIFLLYYCKAIASSIGCPDARVHDLRHSYAVAAIGSGDDIKTVQSNLGHATAAFTLDVYGHVTDQMKQESARRMESYIKDILGQ